MQAESMSQNNKMSVTDHSKDTFESHGDEKTGGAEVWEGIQECRFAGRCSWVDNRQPFTFEFLSKANQKYVFSSILNPSWVISLDTTESLL